LHRGSRTHEKNPLSSAQVTAQMRRNHEAALAQGNGSPHLVIYDEDKPHEQISRDKIAAEENIRAVNQFAIELENAKPTFHRFTQEEQRGLLLGGIIHEEASIIVSRVYGPQGITTDELNDLQEKRLETCARAKGVWMSNPDDILSDQYPIKGKGQESTIYLDGAYVIKNQDTLQSLTLQEAFDDITLFNALFPGAAKQVIGYGRDNEGCFRIVYRQPFIQGRQPTDVEIETFAKSLGLEHSKHRGDYIVGVHNFSNRNTLVHDLHGENVIVDTIGNIHVIDANVHLNYPERNYGGTRKV